MKLTSHQLEAFFETAQRRSFSRAADALSVTQSALSQRIANLEAELEVTLFIREPSGPVLTPAGEILLRHCQVTSSLEREVLSEIKGVELGGVVRIAGYSSVLRSVIIPSLAPLLRSHPSVQSQFRSYEVAELEGVLRNAEADYVVLDKRLLKRGIAEVLLGKEDYVVIESSKHETPENVFLDHDPEDTATFDFFREQSQVPKNLKRSFMGDVFGIVDGVEMGLGRAVMSRHLIEANSKIKVVKGFKKFSKEIVLHFYEKPFYSKLHHQAVGALEKHAQRFLT